MRSCLALRLACACPPVSEAYICLTDEFFILRDPRVASLPALLRDFEDFGALAVNWQVTLEGAASNQRKRLPTLCPPPPCACRLFWDPCTG